MPFILSRRRTWFSSSGQLVLLVSRVTTPLCTARSVRAGSRRSIGSEVTAARTLASVSRSDTGRALRWRTARLAKLAQRATSLRLTHAADARAAIHIRRIRLLTARGIMRRPFVWGVIGAYPWPPGLKLPTAPGLLYQTAVSAC